MQNYQKWLNFDENAVDSDTADMLTISGNLVIDLKQPRTLRPPKEFEDIQLHPRVRMYTVMDVNQQIF